MNGQARSAGMDSAERRHTLWQATARGWQAFDRLSADAVADVAVIGGGFTGLTAALHLARSGARVIVLEADEIGAGASGRNAGFVVPNFAKAEPWAVIERFGEEKGRALLAHVAHGAERVFETIKTLQIDCDAEQAGWLQAADTAAGCELLQRRVEAWRSLGRPIRFLDGVEATRRAGVSAYKGALFDPTGGVINPLSYAYGLARGAHAAGARIVEDASVTSIERDGGRWKLRCGAHVARAEQTLLCTNASAIGIAKRLYRMIVPLAVYQIATQPLPAETVTRFSPERNPVSDIRANLFTYRLDRENRLISGGMSMLPVGAHARMARMIVRRIADELKLDSVPEVEFVWRGVAAMTTDFLPHLYELGPGFIAGVGCNGRGVAMTAMLGETLAQAAGGAALRDLPVPLAAGRPIPFHVFSRAAPSFAIAHARLKDWRAARQPMFRASGRPPDSPAR